MITSGRELAASIFGAAVVDRDWADYEESVELVIGGNVISFVGMTRREVMINDIPTSVAGIGFVCTDAAHRDHGYASILMSVAHNHALAMGLSFALLNAGRPKIYEQLGYWHPRNIPIGWWLCSLNEALWDTEVPVDLKGTW